MYIIKEGNPAGAKSRDGKRVGEVETHPGAHPAHISIFTYLKIEDKNGYKQI